MRLLHAARASEKTLWSMRPVRFGSKRSNRRRASCTYGYHTDVERQLNVRTWHNDADVYYAFFSACMRA